jgi:hypothetical protein
MAKPPQVRLRAIRPSVRLLNGAKPRVHSAKGTPITTVEGADATTTNKGKANRGMRRGK